MKFVVLILSALALFGAGFILPIFAKPRIVSPAPMGIGLCSMSSKRSDATEIKLSNYQEIYKSLALLLGVPTSDKDALDASVRTNIGQGIVKLKLVLKSDGRIAEIQVVKADNPDEADRAVKLVNRARAFNAKSPKNIWYAYQIEFPHLTVQSMKNI